MHPKVREAFEQIDAAVFNSDTFDDPDDKLVLIDYVARWSRELRFNTRPAKERPLTSTQLRMLRGARAGDPWRGVHGQSAHGGAHGTMMSLIRRGLLTTEAEITDAGRKALADDEQDAVTVREAYGAHDGGGPK